MIKLPPKQPTIPPMPKTYSPVVINRPEPANKIPNKNSNEFVIPVMYDDKVIGVCKKPDDYADAVECIIWDKCLSYEYQVKEPSGKMVLSTIKIQRRNSNEYSQHRKE